MGAITGFYIFKCFRWKRCFPCLWLSSHSSIFFSYGGPRDVCLGFGDWAELSEENSLGPGSHTQASRGCWQPPASEACTALCLDCWLLRGLLSLNKLVLSVILGPLLTQFTPRAVSCFEFLLYLCRGLTHALSVLLSYSWAPVCAWWHRHAPDPSWGGCCISVCFLSLHHYLILIEHVLRHYLYPRTVQSPWPQFTYEHWFIKSLTNLDAIPY